MSGRPGHRGYIASRPIQGNRVPQAVQNLVIRDYAKRHGLVYLLSATELMMPNCFMALTQALDELPRIGGLILYSLFMLPDRPGPRREIYQRVLEAGAELHAAVESMRLAAPTDTGRWEELWLVSEALILSPKSL
jgi:sporadic carbohydrate cluster protein (TIGR04323 family)